MRAWKTFIGLWLLSLGVASAADKPVIVVAKDGSGDFTSIREAIGSLGMFSYERVIIQIQNGVYEEKLRLEQDYLTLRGESREETMIRYSIPREEWNENPDTIGPAVVNIFADDIILENLTVENSQPRTGIHAFAVYGRGTRTLFQNCNFLSQGGDTVSLWNYKEGMYYHANCHFQGGVDFVCPRGWCFVRDSSFYEVRDTTALWHAGPFDKNQKFVLKNCALDGATDFNLGRHHYEAQFYFIDCTLSEKVRDRPIYFVRYPDEPARERPFNWGERYYFHNTHRDGGDFDWMKNNLAQAGGAPDPETITAAWTFNHQWDPESTEGPRLKDVKITKDGLLLQFDETLTVRGTPELHLREGKVFAYRSGGGSRALRFGGEATVARDDFRQPVEIQGGEIIGARASVRERPARLTLD